MSCLLGILTPRTTSSVAGMTLPQPRGFRLASPAARRSCAPFVGLDFLSFELKTGRLQLLPQRRLLDAMQALRHRGAGARAGGPVSDPEYAARLQCLVFRGAMPATYSASGNGLSLIVSRCGPSLSVTLCKTLSHRLTITRTLAAPVPAELKMASPA